MIRDKQKIFCDEFLKDFNRVRAYRCAYSVKSDDVARKSAARMLTNADVLDYIENQKKKIVVRNDVSKDRIIEELKKMAFSDIRTVVDFGPGFCDIRESEEVDTSIISEIRHRDTKFGSNQAVKLYDKLKALELLGRYVEAEPSQKHEHEHTHLLPIAGESAQDILKEIDLKLKAKKAKGAG